MKICKTVALLAALALSASVGAEAAACRGKTPAPVATTASPVAETPSPGGTPSVTTAAPAEAAASASDANEYDDGAVVDDDGSEEVGNEDDYSEVTSEAYSTASSEAYASEAYSTASSEATATSEAFSTASSEAYSTASSEATATSEAFSTAASEAFSTAASEAADEGETAVSAAASASTSADETTASDTTSTASSAAAASTSTTSSADHATFGTITSGSATCVVGDPAEYISTDDVNWIYNNRMATDVIASKALIFDQIHANKGSLDYCVRWDSTDKLSLATASKFQAALERQYKAWNNWLIGYDCWPYEEIKINMVGVAVRDASLLDWTDDSLGKIYVGNLDSDNVPQCDQACYKHLNGGLHDDTSACSGAPFDLTLWPTLGLEGGFGSWWGENINAQNFLENIDQESLHILSHEIGHGFGLPDFYENPDFPNSDPTNFPKCIMQAGASMTVTEGDGWMLRRAWENVKPRYFN